MLERFDGRPADDWQPTQWSEYLFAEPRGFLDRLERAAGLPSPSHVPTATPRTLTYRVLAAIAATGFKSVHPIEIQEGLIDTAGCGGGHNENLDAFPIDPERLRAGSGDFLALIHRLASWCEVCASAESASRTGRMTVLHIVRHSNPEGTFCEHSFAQHRPDRRALR